MEPLFAAVLLWAFLFAAVALFGMACIKYGMYTSSNRNNTPSLEI